MQFTIVRQEAASRFQEAQAFLSAIKTLERSNKRASGELNVRKGLFLVLLYGAFEYSLTRTVIEATALINNLEVQHAHVSELLYALALDSHLTSLTMIGRDSKWQRRAALFQKQACAEPVVLTEGAFATELQNVWSATITKLFMIFGITHAALYDPRVRQYIDEVVNKRNAVAHGRESASTVGQAYTSGELQRLLDELSRQSQYIFSVFEGHVKMKEFIKTNHRALY